MTKRSSRFAALADRWPKGIAFLLGAISATGFAPLHLWPLTLVALAGWMALTLRSRGGWRALGIGWFFGIGHFIVGLNWIATAFTYQAAMPAWLGWIAVFLLSLYLAVYPALAAWGAWLASRFGKQSAARGVPISFILAFAALWTLTEWARSWVFTGFAWNPLGAISAGSLASPAMWIGTYGLGALIMAVAGALLLLASRRWLSAAILGAALVGITAASAVTLSAAETTEVINNKRNRQPIPITVIQPNVGQQDKWEGDKADSNFTKLARLTVPKNSQPRMILWPEAAIPDYLEPGYPIAYYDRSPTTARARLTALMNADDLMLLGALKLELDKAGDVVGARNSVMTMRPDGSLGPRYDKAHLVPYGEYLPMRPILSALGLTRLAPGDIDFWPGPGARTLNLGVFGKTGLQICYEIIFSGQVVDRNHRPDFIFNPSNDAWFGSWGPPQHLMQARLRAVEEGLPVIRSTPTGISAIIDANGQVLQSLPMHQAGRIDSHIPRAHGPTLFSRHGNILSVAFALLLLVTALVFRWRGR